MRLLIAYGTTEGQTALDFMERNRELLRSQPSQDFEYTNWEDVDRFVTEFAAYFAAARNRSTRLVD